MRHAEEAPGALSLGTFEPMVLNEFAKMNTGICIINAYPYKGIWCNDAWCKVWECEDRDEWKERASKTMENWSHATHLQMRGLREKVQINHETTTQTFNIFRSDKRKCISVCLRPFELNGEWYILYENVPEKGLVEDSLKRSLEAFKYAVTMITVFSETGDILLQNQASTTFYSSEIMKKLYVNQPQDATALMAIIGNEEVLRKVMENVTQLGVYRGTILQRVGKLTQRIRRQINASYGLDPVTGVKMIVMDETYIREPALNWDKECEVIDSSYKKSDALAQASICQEPALEVVATPSAAQWSMANSFEEYFNRKEDNGDGEEKSDDEIASPGQELFRKLSSKSKLAKDKAAKDLELANNVQDTSYGSMLSRRESITRLGVTKSHSFDSHRTLAEASHGSNSRSMSRIVGTINTITEQDRCNQNTSKRRSISGDGSTELSASESEQVSSSMQVSSTDLSQVSSSTKSLESNVQDRTSQEDIEKYERQLVFYKKKCTQLEKRCRQLALLGTGV